MIDVKFLIKRHVLDLKRVNVNKTEFSPDLLDTLNEYFSKEENAHAKHLSLSVMEKSSKVPFLQRLGYLIPAIEQTIDNSLPEFVHAKNVLHAFNHQCNITEIKKQQKRKNIPSYPYCLISKDNNLYFMIDGEITIKYEDGFVETLKKEGSLPSSGWQPYKEIFKYNVNFDTVNDIPHSLFNIKLIDEGVNFSNMDVNVGLMNANVGENTLSFSSTKESVLIILDGEYDVVSGIQESSTLYTHKFADGCNFTIKHKGEKPTVVVLLEKREL